MRIKNRDEHSAIEQEPDDHAGIVNGKKDADPEPQAQSPMGQNLRTGKNLQNDSFNEIGRTLESEKDSPTDKRKVLPREV
jgi:hypothetical protein